MKLLLSLHDVTPFHLQRLHMAEALCVDLGIEQISYLLVPDYHAKGPSDESLDFVAWCRRDRPFEVEWLLHGYQHIDDGALQVPLTLGARLKRRLMTGQEGEFIALHAAAQQERITTGLAIFRRCLRREPAGFVPPAWLFNDELLPILRQNGLAYTEDHRQIYSVLTGERLKSPVITWATRTKLRKSGSIVAAPLLARVWRRQKVVRVAMHPFDFDHPDTVDSIRRLLNSLLPLRRSCFFDDLDFAGVDK